jgi:16S rRNA A1518/A1519 N6-dimethyltransferase RsmA/KsgA/DIM1 with predicted DNA glycosylase/AP lyase activity
LRNTLQAETSPQPFGQRYKTLRNAVKALAVEADLECAAIDPGARPNSVCEGSPTHSLNTRTRFHP